jgi:hypothetical protein
MVLEKKKRKYKQITKLKKLVVMIILKNNLKIMHNAQGGNA